MSARLCLFAALLAALALAAPCFAQGVKAERGKKYALLVGVKEYNHSSLPDLRHTENDVETLAGVLQQSGGFTTVVVLTTTRGKKDEALKPTAKNIRTQLKKLADKVTKHDLLLIALSGHGLQIPVVLDAKTEKEKDESFFCPEDARPRAKLTMAELRKTLIPLTETFKEMEESGAGVKLLLVDACRNEVKLDSGTRNVDVETLPRPASGVAALFSCKSGERAYETAKLGKGHGVFFYHVIEAMKGKAKNDKGQITWSRLAEYVTDEVSDRVPTIIGGGAKQTPHEMKNIVGRSPVLVGAATLSADVEKLYETALRYDLGSGDKDDPAEAMKWYLKAADKGHRLSMSNIGVLYAHGRGVKKDYSEAMKWYGKAAEKGEPQAMSNVGNLHYYGMGVGRDEAEAVKWYRKAAALDNAVGQYNLAWMLQRGAGVRADPKEAMALYRKAVAQNHADAMVGIGELYLGGLGVKKDEAEAVRWFKKAMAAGSLVATDQLGHCYYYGQGVTKDVDQAAALYRKAAEGGFSGGMTNLGWMYERGEGVKKDEAEAARWYRKAADLGESFGMNYLGHCYYYGRGVRKDAAKAFEWYRKAAALGHVEGQYNVAWMYDAGEGTTRDIAEATAWYRKAAAGGDEKAKKRLKELRQ